LGSNGQFEVIEYDIDEDGLLDYATADINGNGLIENDELYKYQDAVRRWDPVIPGALPFPFLPIFPY
jgi:predicted oxidoreductase